MPIAPNVPIAPNGAGPTERCGKTVYEVGAAHVVAVLVAEGMTLPISVLRTRFVTQPDHPRLSIRSCASKLYANSGIRGFYAGSAVSLFAQVCSTANKFTLYEMFKRYRNTRTRDLYNNILNGAAAGVIGATMAHPLDVIKTYRQRQIPFRTVFQQDGFRVFRLGYAQTVYRNLSLYGLLLPFYDAYSTRMPSRWMASLAASVSTTLVLQPLDLVKTRLISKQSWVMRDLYQGFTLNLARSAPHMLITVLIRDAILSQ